MDANGHALRDVEGTVSALVPQLRTLDLEDTRLCRENFSHKLHAHPPNLRQLRCLVVFLKRPHAPMPQRSLAISQANQGCSTHTVIDIPNIKINP